jgi:hypothetical protein
MHFVLAASSYVAAAFGLVGSVIGAATAGTVSYLVSRQTREAAEKAWIRDSRREVFDRFMTGAQNLQAACEICVQGGGEGGSRDDVERAFNDFFHSYAVVQTIAERRVVEAARIHGYRLHELRDEALGKRGKLNPPNFWGVDKLVRKARHGTVQAMRDELGLSVIEPPGENFNAFTGTELETLVVSDRQNAL